MNPAQFDKFLAEVQQLTGQQVRYLSEVLKGKDPVERLINQLEQRLIDHPECPHCHSSLINRHGKVANMQRYRCKNCGKTFVATTSTPLARLRFKGYG